MKMYLIRYFLLQISLIAPLARGYVRQTNTNLHSFLLPAVWQKQVLTMPNTENLPLYLTEMEERM